MNLKLKPYPEYKDSGLPWLGQIPEHWKTLPNRALFEEVKDRNHPAEPLLSVTIRKGVIRQADLLASSSQKDLSNENKSNYKLVKPNDIAYNKMRAWQGALGVSKYRGIVSPAYIVVRLRGLYNSYYFHYLMRTPAFAKEAERWSYGITSDQWSLRPEHFKQIYCCLPEPSEQDDIVAFLRHVDSLLNRLIRSKLRLITLLNEKKRAFIHQVVTCGLNNRVYRKPSVAEWIEEIPVHWEIQSIKRLARTGHRTFTDGDWIELPYITKHGIRLIQTGNVGIGEYREKGFRYVSDATFKDLGCTEVQPKDILICRLDGPVGRACVVPDLGCKAITSVDNTILKVKPNVDPRYIVYCLSSPLWLDWVQSLCRAGGGFRYRVSRSTLGNLRLPLPPLQEQREIADHLDRSLVTSHRGVQRTSATIDLLREYRTRLITDVVTGKRDVRGVEIPTFDEDVMTEDLESLDELEPDEIDDTEEIPDDAEECICP